MAKAAKSGQARSFNAMMISRINEDVLECINGEKLQNAIDKPDSFIQNFIRFINNDCRVTSGPLVIELDRPPGKYINTPCSVSNEHLGIGIKSNEPLPPVLFNSNRIKFVKKHKRGEDRLSAKEYLKRLREDKTITVANANGLEFFLNNQFIPEVAKFLEPFKYKELYQFGTLYDGNRTFFSSIYWNGKLWVSKSWYFDDNCIFSGYAIVVSND